MLVGVEPNMKALKRRGFTNHGSTLSPWYVQKLQSTSLCENQFVIYPMHLNPDGPFWRYSSYRALRSDMVEGLAFEA